MKNAIFKTIKPFLITLLIIELVEFFLWQYDLRLTNAPDGYIKGISIGSVFSVLRWFWLAFSLPILLFKITKNNVVRGIASAILMSLIVLLIIEGLSALAVRTNVVKSENPNYPKLFQPISVVESTPQIAPKSICADINPIWGVWHYADSAWHTRPCFNVQYKKNSYGARDKDRDVRSNKTRFAVLGDSFVEGFGVDENARFTNLIEAKTNEEYLNFGTSGDFGPTQYYLVYKHLAKKFTHQAVIVCIFPSNDFENDDITNERYAHRYRPYWTGNYPNYKLTYSLSKLEDSDWYPSHIETTAKNENELSLREKTAKFLKENSYLYNICINLFKKKETQESDSWVSKYESFEEAEWQKMLFSLEKITEEANGKPIIILSFPAMQDLKARQKAEKPLALTKQFEEITAKKNKKWLYIDFLEYFYGHSKNWNELFLSCDPHWSPTGHKLAAEALMKNTAYQNLITQLPTDNK